jgi:4-amino-4-deoxy-L-arabinose transferase-like glycosyltransferase
LSGADEPRYARIAQEMHDQGRWITPTLEGKPWLEKPPLYYWISIPLVSHITSPETAARAGPAVCALISALVVFRLGSLLWTRLAGLLGSLILLTSLGFAGYGRSASTDMPFTCCLTVALAILAAAAERAIGRRNVLWAYVFLGLAVLAKGPAAFLLAAGIMFLFWFLDDRRIVSGRWHVLAGFAVAAVVSVPWFWLAFRQNGYAFIATFFINHNLARFVTDIHHHSQPFYYYFVALLAMMFPWSGWLPVLVSKSPIEGLRGWRKWNPGLLFLSCWTLFPLFFFSLSDSKLAGYILPALPPLALILGVRLSRWTQETAEKMYLRPAVFLQLLFSIAMAVAATVYFHRDYGGNWRSGLMLSAAILIPALVAFGFGIRGNCRRSVAATVLQGLLVILATTQFAFPVLGDYHSTRDIARRALELREAGEPIITYGFFHHTLDYYSGYQVVGKLDTPHAAGDFGEKRPRFLVVTNERRMPEILNLDGFSASILAKQGNTRLVRLTRK